jgi:hypothetical protein
MAFVSRATATMKSGPSTFPAARLKDHDHFNRAGDPVWSPDGKWLAFVSDIYPECRDDACNSVARKRSRRTRSKLTSPNAFYRHWKSWKNGMRTHVFVVASAGGEARDLTPGITTRRRSVSVGQPTMLFRRIQRNSLSSAIMTKSKPRQPTLTFGWFRQRWNAEEHHRGESWLRRLAAILA